MSTQPSKNIECFPNSHPDRDYEISFDIPEFTCLCPLSGQPDFARISIRYIPDQKIIESKSLKLYMWSFRDEKAFHEKVTNDILDHLVSACEPRWMEVVGDFNRRGGIASTIRAEYKRS